MLAITSFSQQLPATTESEWFPNDGLRMHPFRMRSSLRTHPKQCPPGTTYQSSIYRFWSDNATQARNLQPGTVTWGGCYPHMQILHKGTNAGG